MLFGVAMIATSILVLMRPLEAYISLALVFSWFILLSGAFHLVFALQNRRSLEGWFWYLIIALAEIFIGAAMLFNPPLSAGVLLLYMGFWFAFRGAMALGTAWFMRQLKVPGWGWLLALGLATLTLSFLMVLRPAIGVLSIVALTSAAFMLMGIFSVTFALGLKKLNRLLHEPA